MATVSQLPTRPVAVNHVQVDWNQQAVLAAKGYMQMGGFSCSGMVQQLDSPSPRCSKMPTQDVKTRWLQGCFGGTMLAMIQADQSNGT